MLVSVVDDAADLSELGRYCRVLQLIAKLIDPLFGILAATDLVAKTPADHEAEGGHDQHPERDEGGVLCHADFSRAVVACSRSTRWIVARETRCALAHWPRLCPRSRSRRMEERSSSSGLRPMCR